MVVPPHFNSKITQYARLASAILLLVGVLALVPSLLLPIYNKMKQGTDFIPIVIPILLLTGSLMVAISYLYLPAFSPQLREDPSLADHPIPVSVLTLGGTLLGAFLLLRFSVLGSADGLLVWVATFAAWLGRKERQSQHEEEPGDGHS